MWRLFGEGEKSGATTRPPAAAAGPQTGAGRPGQAAASEFASQRQAAHSASEGWLASWPGMATVSPAGTCR